MNTRESKCVKIMTDMIENDGLVGIKTSFEDEGATFNETVRLKQVCNEAKTKVTLKIGGPEAIRDLKDSSIIGINAALSSSGEKSIPKFVTLRRNFLVSMRAGMLCS